MPVLKREMSPKQTFPTGDIGQTFFSPKIGSKWAFKADFLAMDFEYNVLGCASLNEIF